MFSIYASAFNLIKNNFDYKGALNNFSAFADEVVLAINTSEDNTFEVLQSYITEKGYTNVVLIQTSFDYKDNEFDGKIKNAALQATKQPLKVSMDMDERIPLSQKDKWIQYGNIMLQSNMMAFFVPTIDLWGDKDHIRMHSGIGVKWRIHKKGCKRGVVNSARRMDGKIDTSMSDTCELIDAGGELIPTAHIITNPTYMMPIHAKFLKPYIYTVHYGYLDFQYRLNINKFWKEKWEDRSGQPENVATTIQELTKEKVIKHNLPLE